MLTWECQQSIAAPDDIGEILGCYMVVSIEKGKRDIATPLECAVAGTEQKGGPPSTEF